MPAQAGIQEVGRTAGGGCLDSPLKPQKDAPLSPAVMPAQAGIQEVGRTAGGGCLDYPVQPENDGQGVDLTSS